MTTLQLRASDGNVFPAYLVKPEGTARGAVVVIQEIFGVNSHIRRVTEQYAAQGYLAKGGKLGKVVVPVRSRAPMDICIAVPRPGEYAVAVHHDINGNGDKDASDGGGYSGNPRLSITHLRPSFGRTAVQVGRAPRQVPVLLQYRRGLSIGPVNS